MSGDPAGGCGCGQGGQQLGCGCGRAAVARDGAFARPVFFDGQLLTSDDLQALVAYTRGKDRLHNRYLVGSGVVCGLEVVCSRAAPGSVVVRSGYALDCCGNDIVVACDQQVDLMELMAGLTGDGCTDPCPSATTDAGQGKPDAGQQEEPAAGQQGKPVPQPPAKPVPRRYELVVEYAETAGDLVAPYASGDESSRTCEPTRCHEGYRFMLRCPNGRCNESGLAQALACCADAQRYIEPLEEATSAAQKLVGGGEPIAEPPSSEELDEATKALRTTPDLPRAVRLASMAVRLAAAGQVPPAGSALEVVRDVLEHIRETADDPLTSAQVDALDQETGSLTGRLAEPVQTRADRLLAEGIVYGKQVGDTLSSLVTEARDWALCWLEQRPTTHCRPAVRLDRLSVPADGQDKELYEAAKEVTAVVRQILLDCVCAAINPPCAPCDDVAVVLAEVKIDGCEVVDICSLTRRYPLTGTALRYWLPVDWLLCEAERACCAGTDLDRALADISNVLRALGGQGRYAGRGLGSAAYADQAPGGERTVQEEREEPEKPLSPGQHQLLKMLNSQVQSMQAKVRKLERAEQERAASAEGAHG
jgi:hypothetical protein